MPNDVSDLPVAARRVLEDFSAAVREALGADLVSLVLYGSAAEGRLRATSDVNLLLVLSEFRLERVNALRESTRAAHASIRLDTMFLLQRELPEAVDAFAVKFADILKRRRVLYGSDPFANTKPSRHAELLRLRQVLLNLSLRLRRAYVLVSLHEEQAALAIAEAAGPLRSAAAALLELQGRRCVTPRVALQSFATELGDEQWTTLVAQLSEAREQRVLHAASPATALFGLLALTDQLRSAAARLGEAAP